MNERGKSNAQREGKTWSVPYCLSCNQQMNAVGHRNVGMDGAVPIGSRLFKPCVQSTASTSVANPIATLLLAVAHLTVHTVVHTMNV